MAVKVAVVGGGSSYTPELIDGFLARADRVPVDELALLDVDAERLEIVAGLAQRMARRAGWRDRAVTWTTDPHRALDGAHFVIVQLRVGGQRARLGDETLPLRFGCVGQETTGPGGFAKALRTVPVVLDIADRVARWADPAAWIVDFTNPVGIVTQALLDEGHRAIGLCNVAIGLQREFAGWLDVEPQRIELDHVGLNHLTWERAIRLDGRDVLPGLLADDLDRLAALVGLPASLVGALAAVPSYYLRYYYLSDDVVAEQRTGVPRAEEVMAIEAELMAAYRDPSTDSKPALLGQRGGAYYSEAAAELVASLHDGRGDVQVVNVRNRGAVDGLPSDAVVEVPAVITGDGAQQLPPTGPLPPEMRGLVQEAKAYEDLTLRAALSGSRTTALKALLANPLVPSYGVAEPLLAALLEANRRYLPRFFGD
ncbi:MAG TPA: 6-phospho-beta-glucosidase [Acidimicrobiales bacterium]|nr:6-phospho-beta-glucosidase [Acidimicrobiales bacterium]